MPTFSVYKVLSLFFFLLLFTSCKLDRKKEIDRNRFSFKAYSDTKTFFQNVRLIYYDREVIGNGTVVAFRFKDRIVDTTTFHLAPTIVLNQDTNDTLIFLESTQPFDTLTISINNKTLQLKSSSRNDVLEFCTIVYEGIMQEKEILLLPGSKPLFTSTEEKDDFRKVMSDYYRLTRVFY